MGRGWGPASVSPPKSSDAGLGAMVTLSSRGAVLGGFAAYNDLQSSRNRSELRSLANFGLIRTIPRAVDGVGSKYADFSVENG
jgi:hypothetical protein